MLYKSMDSVIVYYANVSQLQTRDDGYGMLHPVRLIKYALLEELRIEINRMNARIVCCSTVYINDANNV